MAEGSITDWLDGTTHPSGADPDGTDRDAALGAPHQGREPDYWRPDVDEAAREERARRLWRLAGMAWGALILAGAVLLAVTRATGSPADPGQEVAMADHGETAPDDDPAAWGPDAAGPGATARGGAPMGVPVAGAAGTTDGALAALAALAVRLAVTADEDPARYVDLAQPESLERHGDVAVVTVTAVLLEGRDGRWETVRPARYGVALREEDAGPVVLGTPWALPSPDADALPGPDAESLEAPPADPVEDAGLVADVTAALAAVGWGEPSAVALVPDSPPPLLRVRVTAAAPGEAAARTHDIWLEDGEVLRVAGSPR
jgi:hypothetical protein